MLRYLEVLFTCEDSMLHEIGRSTGVTPSIMWATVMEYCRKKEAVQKINLLIYLLTGPNPHLWSKAL